MYSISGPLWRLNRPTGAPVGITLMRAPATAARPSASVSCSRATLVWLRKDDGAIAGKVGLAAKRATAGGGSTQRVAGAVPVDLLLGPQHHASAHELLGSFPLSSGGVLHRHFMRVALDQRGQLQGWRTRQGVAVGAQAVG